MENLVRDSGGGKDACLPRPKYMRRPRSIAVGTEDVGTACLALSPWGLVCLKGSINAQWTGAQFLRSESCLCLLEPVRPWTSHLILDLRFPRVQNGINDYSFVELLWGLRV